jgi:DNA-binding transcriptional ArsR family regulator
MSVTAAIFEILAEPNRRRVLDLLRQQEHTVGELVDALDMSQPAVSKHLRVLREAGLVEARVDAQRRIYSLRPEPLADVDAWLAPYRKFWRGKLAALHRRIERDN